MSDTESLDYLQTGFDPASLTIPRLRSILVSYNIPYPSSAKKPQLIEIFNENVVPQSKKILAARSRAKRTSRGITDADSSQDGTLADDGELMPPPPTPRSRSGRKPSSKHKVEDSESETPQRSPTKRTPRTSSAKHSRASDTETGTDADGVQMSVRKSRKSEARIKVEEQQDELPTPLAPKTSPLNHSAFSHDNPFQSGSSPLSGIRSVSGERRRITVGGSTTKDPGRRKSGSTSRRRTDGPISGDFAVPHTSTPSETPISKMNSLADVDNNGVGTTEEFTPEEPMELVRERSTNGLNTVGPVRRKKKVSKRSKATSPIWIVLMTLMSGYAVWYRKEKLAIGYCGVGRDSRELSPATLCTPHWATNLNAPEICKEIDIPDWLVTFAEPTCEPCPQHATCFDQFQTVCDQDFVLRPNPLSLGGLIPLPPTCEPDGEKVRKVKVVADRAVEELRERRAKFECGDLVEDDGTPATSVEIDAEDLKKEVSKKRRPGMSESEFEDLWAGAIGEIQAREEVEVVVDGTPKHGSEGHAHSTRLSSTSLARVSLTCSVRRWLRLTVARYRLQVSLLTFLASLVLYARFKYRSHLATVAAVPRLVSHTLDRLANQAAWHAQDKEGVPEAWISIGQLRDDVLRDEHSASKREALWTRVRKIVEMNANIRPSQREGRNGEISRVWEWIGAVGAIEGSEERRRKSGRVSWGAYGDGSSPVSGTDGGPEMVQQKWQESRPIY